MSIAVLCVPILQDPNHYNKLEDPTDEENDMLDLAFGLTETYVPYSRTNVALFCQSS